MTRAVSLFEFMPYGAPELQSVARQYMVRALLLGSTLCTTVFVIAGLFLASQGTLALAPPQLTLRIDTILPPPAIPNMQVVPPAVPAGLSHVEVGVPVPTPDDRVSIESTIPSQQDLNVRNPGLEAKEGTSIVVEIPPTPPSAEKPWEPYVYVEELPVPVHTVTPEYSTIAKEAGVSGRVIAHALVDRTGHVIDVRIDPEFSIPMLNDDVVRAVRQWVFTPAMANGRPVQVWVSVPFSFALH